MNWFLFASFIPFLLWFTFMLSRRKKLDQKQQETFWEQESRANSTRRQSLDCLEYITIPFDRLPMEVMPDNERVKECLSVLRSLSDSPIVNLTGYTNTELKLAYGAPNIDLLTRYDQSYTVFARTLQQWAQLLYEGGCRDEAKQVLELAVSTRTDVSGTYRLLAQIYREEGRPERIQELIPVAESLNSAMREPIVRMLRESGR